MSVPHAAGALYSTVDDLFLWHQALRTDRLLPAKAREAMFTPFRQNYGYGWAITRQFGRRAMEHGGGINGFSTYLLRFPDEDVCVIVLSNVEGASMAPVARELARIALGEPDAPALPPQLLDAYVGRYVGDDPEGTIVVYRDGPRLLVRVGDRPAVEVAAVSDTTFTAPEGALRVEFVKGQGGRFERLVLHEKGRDVEARRRGPGDEPGGRP
jgi:hypothetical protein